MIRRQLRRGVTLIEIVVVMAIMGVMMAVAVPSVRGILDLEQAGAAEELALTYKYLRDEAALRHVSFRIAYNLDTRSYKIEVGDPNTLIFTDPDEREEFEEEIQDQIDRFTDREIEEGAANDLEDKKGRFEGLSDPALDSEVTLPTGSYFSWVYTPQYGDEPVIAPTEGSEDPDEQLIVYSYIFPSGSVEHTLIRIADVDDDDDGFTIEVEPVSGEVRIDREIRSPEDSMSWIPDEGPELRL